MEVSSVSVRDEAKERNSDDLSGGIGQAAPESSGQPVGDLRPRLLDHRQNSTVWDHLGISAL